MFQISVSNAGGASKQDIWGEALKVLSEEDKARYDQRLTKGLGQQHLLNNVLEAALVKREECKQRRWKISVKGKSIILRDVLEKMAVWVKKFIVCLQFVKVTLEKGLISPGSWRRDCAI